MNRSSFARSTLSRNSIYGDLLLAILFSMLPQYTRATDLNQIVNAWSQRTEALKSAQFRCNLTRIATVSGAAALISPIPADPYEKPAAGTEKDVTLKSQIMFSIQDLKMACIRTGEVWDSQKTDKVAIAQTDCFDGERSQFLILGGALPLAGIETGKRPTDHLLNHVETFPLLLSISPRLTLECRDFLVKQIKVTNEKAMSNGVPCVELTIPNKAGGQSAGLLYVDPARSYLPLKFVVRAKHLSREVDLEYKTNDKLGWMLSKWRTSQSAQSAESRLRIDGVVESCVVNESLNKSTFTVTFPAGTHIHEAGKGDYIQQSDGTRKPIAPSEFGVKQTPERSNDIF